MMVRRARGFTLIELLVVIAIIGILAAMLFPVFARARESARKIQCLSNVKNIAMAVQMYLTDYDALPPGETSQEAADFFLTNPGGGTWWCDGGLQTDPVGYLPNRANPYLRWPVILDEYIKNRDVWRCPSAKVEAGASFILAGGNWLRRLENTTGQWGGGGGANGNGPCMTSWPPGWGGSVTDSIIQQTLAVGASQLGTTGKSEKAFVNSIFVNIGALGMKTSAVNDPARFVVVGDSGTKAWETVGIASLLAYPDKCCAMCSGVLGLAWYGDTGCPDGSGCDSDCYSLHANYAWASNPDVQKASARHLGGVNIGYMDGHAKWSTSQSVIAAYAAGELEGLTQWCEDNASHKGYLANCGAPPNGMIFLF